LIGWIGRRPCASPAHIDRWTLIGTSRRNGLHGNVGKRRFIPSKFVSGLLRAAESCEQPKSGPSRHAHCVALTHTALCRAPLRQGPRSCSIWHLVNGGLDHLVVWRCTLIIAILPPAQWQPQRALTKRAHAGPDTIRAGVDTETNLFGTHQHIDTSVGRPAFHLPQHSEYASDLPSPRRAAPPHRRSRLTGEAGQGKRRWADGTASSDRIPTPACPDASR